MTRTETVAPRARLRRVAYRCAADFTQLESALTDGGVTTRCTWFGISANVWIGTR